MQKIGSPRLGRRLATLRRWLSSGQRSSKPRAGRSAWRTAPSLDGKTDANKQTGCRREAQVRGRRARSHGALGKTPCFSCLAGAREVSVAPGVLSLASRVTQPRAAGNSRPAHAARNSRRSIPRFEFRVPNALAGSKVDSTASYEGGVATFDEPARVGQESTLLSYRATRGNETVRTESLLGGYAYSPIFRRYVS